MAALQLQRLSREPFDVGKLRVGALYFDNKVNELTRVPATFPFTGGFASVLGMIGPEYSVRIVTESLEAEECDYLLVSLISAWSYCCLVVYMKRVNPSRRPYVLVGGPFLSTTAALSLCADAAFFGRCDLPLDGILAGGAHPSLWRKTEDPECVGMYELAQPGVLHPYEAGTGCPRRCLFCRYTWSVACTKPALGFVSRNRFRPGEDFFDAVDWRQPRVLTAIDGLTERTRLLVGKNLTDATLRVTLLRAASDLELHGISAKIYVIHAYPWESPPSDLTSLLGVFRSVDEELHGTRHKLTIALQFNHFYPDVFTPMQWEAVNLGDFVIGKRLVLYDGRSILVRSTAFNSTPLAAIIRTVCTRLRMADLWVVDPFIAAITRHEAATATVTRLMSFLPSYLLSRLDIGTPIASAVAPTHDVMFARASSYRASLSCLSILT